MSHLEYSYERQFGTFLTPPEMQCLRQRGMGCENHPMRAWREGPCNFCYRPYPLLNRSGIFLRPGLAFHSGFHHFRSAAHHTESGALSRTRSSSFRAMTAVPFDLMLPLRPGGRPVRQGRAARKDEAGGLKTRPAVSLRGLQKKEISIEPIWHMDRLSHVSARPRMRFLPKQNRAKGPQRGRH
jgi:hypothetical protein